MLKVNKTLWDNIHVFVEILVRFNFKEEMARAIGLARTVV